MNIFVTGGSSGIGLCLVRDLMIDHTVTAPPRFDLDLSVYNSVDLSGYDAITLCAGSDLGGRQAFMLMDDHHWHNTMQVNLLSNMQLIKNFVTTRGEQWSKIIVIGSATTDYLRPGMLAYTISKLALEQFCRGLRQEIHRNIGIAIVRPGLIKTNFHSARCLQQISLAESDQWYDSQSHLLPNDLVPLVRSILQDRSHSLREITVSNGFVGKDHHV